MCDFTKNMFKIDLHSNLFQQTPFKLSTMLDTTKFYILVPVRLTLTFTQGHRVARKLELLQLCCCKATGNSPKCPSGRFCKGDDCKEILLADMDCLSICSSCHLKDEKRTRGGARARKRKVGRGKGGERERGREREGGEREGGRERETEEGGRWMGGPGQCECRKVLNTLFRAV